MADFIGKMNLLAGTVKGRDGDCLVIDVVGLGTMRIPATISASGTIAVAVRPEKMKLYTACPSDDVIAFSATVHHIAYHGNQSHVLVYTQSGIELTATVQNLSRPGSMPRLDERLWIGWAPHDTLVLVD